MKLRVCRDSVYSTTDFRLNRRFVVFAQGIDYQSSPGLPSQKLPKHGGGDGRGDPHTGMDACPDWPALKSI